MLRAFLLAIIFLFTFSCRKKIDLVQYQEGKQLLNVNDVTRNGDKIKYPKIIKISPDSISLGEELLIKIFIDDADLKIVDAFLDCDSVTNPTVDTTTYKVSGCSKGLIVQNDTILIGFHPTQFGMQKFPEITILTRDKERIFRVLKYSFEYKISSPFNLSAVPRDEILKRHLALLAKSINKKTAKCWFFYLCSMCLFYFDITDNKVDVLEYFFLLLFR